MAEQEQRRQSAPRTDEVELEDEVSGDSGQELKADLDDLLDEIDGVLETNAEEIVKNYVQKGGE